MNKEQRTINNKWHSWFSVFCFLFFVFCLILPNFAFLQTQTIAPPETLEEAKTFGKRILGAFPEVLKGAWQGILKIWQKMWDWFKVNIWSKIENWLKPEAEKRKQFFKEGFEREKEEMKEEIKTEIPKVSKSLWERFKELIK